MAGRQIRVTLRLTGNPSFNHPVISMEFTDWFSFADYLKEKTLTGYNVEVRSWTYV